MNTKNRHLHIVKVLPSSLFLKQKNLPRWQTGKPASNKLFSKIALQAMCTSLYNLWRRSKWPICRSLPLLLEHVFTRVLTIWTETRQDNFFHTSHLVANAIHQSQVRLCHQCHQIHQIPFPFWVLLSLWLSTFNARKQLLKVSRRQKILQDESSPKNLTKKKSKKLHHKLNHLLIIIFWSNYFGVNWSSVHYLPFVQQFKISAKHPRQPKNCQRRGAPWMPPSGSNKDTWKIEPFFHKENRSSRWYIARWLKSGKQKRLFLNCPFSGLNHFEPHINRQATSNRNFLLDTLASQPLQSQNWKSDSSYMFLGPRNSGPLMTKVHAWRIP